MRIKLKTGNLKDFKVEPIKHGGLKEKYLKYKKRARWSIIDPKINQIIEKFVNFLANIDLKLRKNFVFIHENFTGKIFLFTELLWCLKTCLKKITILLNVIF